MKSAQFRASADMLAWGIPLTVVGAGAFAWGLHLADADAVLNHVDGANRVGGSGLVTLGVLVGLLGLVLLSRGLWQLATNVDLAAKVAADVLAREESQARAAARDGRR